VLLRAGEIVTGLEVARARAARSARPHEEARGPARLARTLGLTGADTGLDLLDPESPVRLESLRELADHVSGPRVGIRLAAERPWRFWLAGEPSVSAFRPAARRRRSNPAAADGGGTTGQTEPS
jgi:DNA-3-methyladenine glycosylase